MSINKNGQLVTDYCSDSHRNLDDVGVAVVQLPRQQPAAVVHLQYNVCVQGIGIAQMHDHHVQCCAEFYRYISSAINGLHVSSPIRHLFQNNILSKRRD